MSFSLEASTGAVVKVWRQGNVFHAERVLPTPAEAETCSPVELYEVIADLTGLDLDDGRDEAEAMKLAAATRQRFEITEFDTALLGQAPAVS